MLSLIYIIIATSIISLSSLLGIITLSFKPIFLQKILLLLVALSAGTMLGGAFMHLLPEASEILGVNQALLITLLAFCFFFLVEKVLHWRHCHKTNCHVHEFGYLNLIGDSIHNFIDGIVIAGAFLVNPTLGITTSLAIILHEIPQEIGDFGVLLHSGFSKRKAILFNLFVAFTALLGGITGYLLSFIAEGLQPILLCIAAGGFIYIATSDLIPEIRKESSLKKWLVSFGMFIAGLIIMWVKI